MLACGYLLLYYKSLQRFYHNIDRTLYHHKVMLVEVIYLLYILKSELVSRYSYIFMIT